MSEEPNLPRLLFPKFCVVAVLAVVLGSAILEAIRDDGRFTLRAIHTHELRTEATLVIDGKKGAIKIPARGNIPERTIEITAEQKLIEFALDAFLAPLFPISAHNSKTIIIDDIPFQFIHTGEFYICESCRKHDLPKTWTVVDEDSL